MLRAGEVPLGFRSPLPRVRGLASSTTTFSTFTLGVVARLPRPAPLGLTATLFGGGASGAGSRTGVGLAGRIFSLVLLDRIALKSETDASVSGFCCCPLCELLLGSIP